MIIFKDAECYVGSFSSIRDKITAIEAIQDALLATALKSVEKGHISQYTLNDGQTIIQTTYRNTNEVMESYNGLEKILNMLRQKIMGRRVRLVDSKSFNGRGGV